MMTPEQHGEMGFFEHLVELRSRVIHALWGLIPGFAVAWWLREHLLEFLVRPMVVHWRAHGLGEPRLNFANPVDPFVAYMKIALVAGLLFSSPWVFWQLWRFISPGLHRHEKRLAIPFVLFATLFFVGGASFGYWVVFPSMFDTLLGFAGALPSGIARIEPTIMIGEYLGFCTQLLLAFGVVFEIPVVVLTLAALRLVTAHMLWKFGRWWLLIATILAAILTPPDVGSQLIMLGPLLLLYFISVGLVFVMEKRRPTTTDH